MLLVSCVCHWKIDDKLFFPHFQKWVTPSCEQKVSSPNFGNKHFIQKLDQKSDQVLCECQFYLDPDIEVDFELNSNSKLTFIALQPWKADSKVQILKSKSFQTLVASQQKLALKCLGDWGENEWTEEYQESCSCQESCLICWLKFLVLPKGQKNLECLCEESLFWIRPQE